MEKPWLLPFLLLTGVFGPVTGLARDYPRFSACLALAWISAPEDGPSSKTRTLTREAKERLSTFQIRNLGDPRAYPGHEPVSFTGAKPDAAEAFTIASRIAGIERDLREQDKSILFGRVIRDPQSIRSFLRTAKLVDFRISTPFTRWNQPLSQGMRRFNDGLGLLGAIGAGAAIADGLSPFLGIGALLIAASRSLRDYRLARNRHASDPWAPFWEVLRDPSRDRDIVVRSDQAQVSDISLLHLWHLGSPIEQKKAAAELEGTLQGLKYRPITHALVSAARMALGVPPPAKAWLQTDYFLLPEEGGGHSLVIFVRSSANRPHTETPGSRGKMVFDLWQVAAQPALQQRAPSLVPIPIQSGDR